MFFFGKKKKKRKEKKENGKLKQQYLQGDEQQDSKKMQHQILECCEQIMEASREIQNEKEEYRIVTDYLTDIQVIEELPQAEKDEITEVAKAIQKLIQTRDDMQKNAKSNITDSQFIQMQQSEKDIPDAIRRLQQNETYQNTVKRDMGYLEGEKTEWSYHFTDLMKQQEILKKLSIALISIFVIVMTVLFTLQIGFDVETTFVWLWLVLFTAVGAFFIFMKMQSNQQEIAKSQANVNYAIQLLNKIKFKYVNITNAVDYACEKFHVHNSYELNYIWEQYLLAVREREKFKQTNQDLEYYSSKLVKILERYRLYDASIWENQAVALIDKKEMVEVKHNLIARRQKLRGRIEYNSQHIRTQRDSIDQMLRQKESLPKEVIEIITSIDKLSSMNS